MSKGNFWGRVDNDQRHADYRYDQKLFEQGLSKRTAEVFDALKRKNHKAAAWALGITNAQDANPQAEQAQANKTTGEPSVDDELVALFQDIRDSDFIPKYLQSYWIKGLKVISTHEQDVGQKCIHDFKIAFSDWKKANRPAQSIWDIGNTRISFYDCEMLLIECKVDRISWLLSSLNGAQK